MNTLSGHNLRRKLDAEFARMTPSEQDAFIARAKRALGLANSALSAQLPGGKLDGINGARLLGVSVNSPSGN